MFYLLKTLVTKELLSYLRDPRTRLILIGPPLAQLLVFSFAATLTVSNVRIAVLDEDGGYASDRLIEQIAMSGFVRSIVPVHTPGELQQTIDNAEVIAALRFDASFSRDLLASSATAGSDSLPTANMQIVLDGRRANAAQITLSYLTQIAAEFSASLGAGTRDDAVVVRHWFNPNLDYQWFIVPSLAGLLAMTIAILVTALSIARERELGTFDQLLVSPLSPLMIIAGKTVPALLIGFALGTLMIAVGIVVFRVPFTGSIPLLAAALALFILSIVGIGLAVSSVSQTQQQAILGAFALLVPLVLTSGFATPVDNMPQWLQTASMANPLRHFLVIVQGSFTRALPPVEVLRNAAPLLVIAVVSLGFAAGFTRSRLH